MITPSSNKENSIYIIELLLRKLRIKVSSNTLTQKLLEHPDYPSLLSLSDCLTSLNVPNEAYLIKKEDYIAEEIPKPFIAHLKVQGGQFILVNEIIDGKVVFSNEHEKNGVFTEEEFLKRWDGVMLYAEKDSQSSELDYKQALIKGLLNKIRLPFLIFTTLASVLYAINYSSVNWAYAVILIINLFGIVVSTLLLVYSVNSNNSFVQNLCSLGKKNDCNTILKSEAAKITDWLNWSEVGMFYFSGSFICLLLNPSSFGFLSWLTLFSLPYTFFSIRYQIKAKTWCLLCCSIQALIWCQALTFLFQGNLFSVTELRVSTSDLMAYGLSFLVPIGVWSFIKPFFVDSAQLQPLKTHLKRLMSNKNLFNKLLSAQQKYEVPTELMPIILGNPDADSVITMVSNPVCSACATAHQTLDTWLNYRDDFQVKVVFATSNQDDVRTKVANHLIALGMLNDKKIVEEALSNWFKEPGNDYDDWTLKFPVTYDKNVILAAEMQKDWCQAVDIAFTPTILVNGYKLIDPYQLKDIEYLIA